MKLKQVEQIYAPQNINGVVPGIRGQRAFPSFEAKHTDPFVLLDHIGPQYVGKDFSIDGSGHDHPHRGFETVTIMLEGMLHHRDSLGNRLTLDSGGVQRMNAGAGIIHGGDMSADPDTGRFHEVQLWVNNHSSQKMSTPELYHVNGSDVPALAHAHGTLRVFAGTVNGMTGPLKTRTPTQIAHFKLSGLGTLQVGPLEEGHVAFIYVLDGSLEVNDTSVSTHHLVDLSDVGDSIEIDGAKNAEGLILTGKPLGEPVAMGGPFVMNTQEEIRQAEIDFAMGLFGQIAN